jgi:hypothetical protein
VNWICRAGPARWPETNAERPKTVATKASLKTRRTYYVEEQFEACLAAPNMASKERRGYCDALQGVPAVDGTDAVDVARTRVMSPGSQSPVRRNGNEILSQESNSL